MLKLVVVLGCKYYADYWLACSTEKPRFALLSRQFINTVLDNLINYNQHNIDFLLWKVPTPDTEVYHQISPITAMASSTKTRKPFPQPAAGYTQSFWRTELDPLDNHRSTPDLPTKTDILIIGGGYAGASAAYHLFPEDQQGIPPKVVLLEARELCSGATGRNGLCPMSFNKCYS